MKGVEEPSRGVGQAEVLALARFYHDLVEPTAPPAAATAQTDGLTLTIIQ